MNTKEQDIETFSVIRKLENLNEALNIFLDFIRETREQAYNDGFEKGKRDTLKEIYALSRKAGIID